MNRSQTRDSELIEFKLNFMELIDFKLGRGDDLISDQDIENVKKLFDLSIPGYGTFESSVDSAEQVQN